MFRGFLNNSIPEILKSKNLFNELLNKLPKNYYFEILVLKYLKIPGTRTSLLYLRHAHNLITTIVNRHHIFYNLFVIVCNRAIVIILIMHLLPLITAAISTATLPLRSQYQIYKILLLLSYHIRQ